MDHKDSKVLQAEYDNAIDDAIKEITGLKERIRDINADLSFKNGKIARLESAGARQNREIVELKLEIKKLLAPRELLRSKPLLVLNKDDLIESLSWTISDKKRIISELKLELDIRNVPGMKESLKSGARLALEQDDVIKSLSRAIADKDTIISNHVNDKTLLRDAIAEKESVIVDYAVTIRNHIREKDQMANRIKALEDLDNYKDDMTVLAEILRIINMTHAGERGGKACQIARDEIYSAVANYVNTEG